MRKEQYEKLIEELTYHRRDISDSKRKDYTRGEGHKDALKNFKQVAEYTGLDPLEVWMVYASKHWDSICSYIKNGTESEPIRERYCDLLNYLELGYALIKEKEDDGEFVTGIDYEYSVGDKVKVIDNIIDHRFNSGEVVELIEYDGTYWVGKNDNGNEWFLTEKEFEKI